MKHDTLLGWLDHYADTQADFPVFNYLKDGETEVESMTYARFRQEAQRVAAHLQAQSLTGERVLLLFPQGLDYLVALFGCFYTGAIAVPAYPPRGNRNLLRLRAILQDCDAKAVLSPQTQIKQLARFQADFEGFRQIAYEQAVAEETAAHYPEIKPDHIAYLQYTSGSTGDPKGVVIRHGNMLHNVACMDEMFGAEQRAGRTYVTWVPMYHDMGLMNMMSALKNAAYCYFMSPVHFVQKPARWLQAISRYGAEYTLGPNFAFDYCCDKITDEEMEGVDLSQLGLITNGSEPIRLATLQRFAERFGQWGLQFNAFSPAYGMAEATLIVSATVVYEPVAVIDKKQQGEPQYLKELPAALPHATGDYHTSSGPAVSTATVAIVHPEEYHALPDGQEGEIWVNNPGSIATGYWNREAENEATFRARRSDGDPLTYLRTGDLGFLQDGHLYVTGRIKDMIIVRGRNYYPQDMEQVAQDSHDALEPHSGAAFAVDTPQGEALVIVQEISRHYLKGADTDAILSAIRTAVSQAFDIVPQHIALIKPVSLPKTSSGKVQRYLARQQWQNKELRLVATYPSPGQTQTQLPPAQTQTPSDHPHTHTQPPPAQTHTQTISSSQIQTWLIQKIAEKAKLSPEDIDPTAAVRDYPFESIEAIGLADELARWLGIRLTAEVFWALPTIEKLAEFLAEKHQQQQSNP